MKDYQHLLGDTSIISVHMRCGTELTEFKLQLLELENVINMELESNRNIIIVGDFNSSLYGNNKFSYNNLYQNDKDFIKWTAEINLIVASNLFTQIAYNTYMIGGMTSNIDHLLYGSQALNNIINVNIILSQNEYDEYRDILLELKSKYEMKIDYDKANIHSKVCQIWDQKSNSDHRAIECEVIIKFSSLSVNSKTNVLLNTPQSIRINCEKEMDIASYQNKLD